MMNMSEWKIRNIFEADYGCEERRPGEKLKVLVELENETGQTKTLEAYDEYLTWNHIDVGSVWTEPDEEKKKLFFKQKNTMDALLATGALTKEQYEFSLSGLVVKMGFDFDILRMQPSSEKKAVD